jgi:hypothetical protein
MPANRLAHRARSLGGCGEPKAIRAAAGWLGLRTCSSVVPAEPASQPAQKVWVPGVAVAGMVALAVKPAPFTLRPVRKATDRPSSLAAGRPVGHLVPLTVIA